ncbi:cytochrome P450 [Aspergillus carlsbadensis]|nr:cytochrome P450 [Aspergillus carlsbadensis]
MPVPVTPHRPPTRLCHEHTAFGYGAVPCGVYVAELNPFGAGVEAGDHAAWAGFVHTQASADVEGTRRRRLTYWWTISPAHGGDVIPNARHTMVSLGSTITNLLVASVQVCVYASIAIPLVVVMADFLDGWRRRRELRGIPIVDEGGNMSRALRWNSRPFDADKEYTAAYEKYSKKGQPFAARIQHDDYAIALPPSSAKEWRAFGHEQLNFLHALSEFADLWPHMNVIIRTPIEAIHSCNNDFTMSMASLCCKGPVADAKPCADLERFQSSLATEADKHLHPVFRPADDQEWTELNTLQAVFTATSAIATSLLLGDDQKQAAQITEAAIAHNDSIITSRVVRSHYPRILRPFLWRFAPTCRGLRANAARLRMLISPEIQRRIDRVREKSPKPGDESTPFSLLDVLIDASFKNGTLRRTGRHENEDDLVELIFQQVLLYHFELSRPTGMIVIFMLYTIVSHPEHIPTLRKEWTEAVSRCGGDWTLDILSHAPKLESFTKETFRYHDVSPFVGLRRVMQPLHLKSLNLPLKEGTLIMTPCRAVHHDPEIYSDPATFNGLRFYDPATNTCTPKVFTTSPTFLTFSHGTGTCPARNFATQIARMVFIKILTEYDVHLAHEAMPAYSLMDPSGAIYFPNPAIKMRVRRRGEDGGEHGNGNAVHSAVNGFI